MRYLDGVISAALGLFGGKLPSFKVCVPLSYPPDKDASIGDVVSDLPASSIEWLVDQGLIETVSKSTKKVSDTVVDEVGA